MVNEASTMEPGCNGGVDGGSMDGGKEACVVVDNHLPGGDQGVQLRSSARVSKKLKLDSQAAASAATSVKKGDPEDKPPTLQTSPVSGGVGVGNVGIATATTATATVGTTAASAVAAAEPQRGKGRRGNETSLWSMDDKNAFFESLNEFGKDFDAIHHHIEMKARKRGEQEPKSRDQVRHFYYRTWNKISKHLRFPEGTAKVTQELYGLVNYGEMRKKIGYPYTAKNSHKLKELIFLGSTQIRIKGKTWRIKTPICKALRKLNALEDCCEEVLPPRVTVELRPRDNRAWAHVQSLAYNPRVCAELSLHRRLRSLIAHLQSRWRHLDDKLRQAVGGGGNDAAQTATHNGPTSTPPDSVGIVGIQPLPDTSPPTDTPTPDPTPTTDSSPSSLSFLVPSAQTEDALELCVAPQQGAQMVDASFKMSAIATSAKLSFLAYTDRQGKDYGHILAELQAASKNSRQRAGALKRQRSDSNSCEKGGGGSLRVGGAAEGELHAADGIEQLELQLAEHLPSLAGCELVNNADLVFSDEAHCGGDTSPVKGGAGGGEGDVDQDDVTESVSERRARIASSLLQKARHGWTADNADATCVGEVYVMFGSDSRLILEYWWRKKGEAVDDPPPDVPKPDLPLSTPVTTALQKLLSLAKLSYSKTRLTCPCGHVCNQPAQDSANQAAASAQPARGGVNHRVRVGAPSKGEGGVQAPPLAPSPQGGSVPMDGVFRRPVLAPLRPKAADTSGDQFKFKAQLDKFKLLRFCNRRGRNSRSKNVVVPRILPLLPKVPADKQLMLKLRPAPTPGGGGTLPPISSNNEVVFLPPSYQQGTNKEVVGNQLMASQLITFAPTATNFNTVSLNSNHVQLVPVQQIVSSEAVNEKVDVVPDTQQDESIKEEKDELKVNAIEDEPPPSPMGLLKEEMLINTDDYSLSSLLGHLESPDKNCATAFGDDARHIADVSCDDSRLPDVDAQLESLMCEDSVDYMGKFADLAAKLTSDSLSHDND
ncbi:hypothetical protein LSTR_LSTR010999 [Laodelphax striatellus]|uniref:Myb-like domain-containing protein n=1 Tax=Laodelphax striatellus TaxID=195883 RepID=A0A482X4U1_LAOST|nr:hypothetical protein LSTR_LSTR010999 [Laodelphax striatellus]